MSASFRDYLQLHFLVVLWGFTAILGLLITIRPVELVFYRTLVSLLALGIIMLYKNISFKIDSRALLAIISVGFVVGLHWLLFFLSARVSTASVCLAGLATLLMLRQ